MRAWNYTEHDASSASLARRTSPSSWHDPKLMIGTPYCGSPRYLRQESYIRRTLNPARYLHRRAVNGLLSFRDLAALNSLSSNNWLRTFTSSSLTSIHSLETL